MRLAVTLVYTVPFEVEAYSPKAAWLDLELRLPTLTWSMKPTLWTLPPLGVLPKVTRIALFAAGWHAGKRFV